MGKEVVNADATSEQPLEKKARKLIKVGGKKNKKKSSKVKIAGPEKVNTEENKKVEDSGIKENGSIQANEEKEANTKVAEPTKETFGGFIFMCNGRTKPDCFRYKVLGLPENRRDWVLRIKPGTKLFLYDFHLRLLYGIYKASSFGGMMLEPAAFNGCYPAQVRFEVDSARPPLTYEVFKHAIKDNFTGTSSIFKTELSFEQVRELTKLFSILPEQPQAAVSTNAPMLPSLPQPTRALATARLPAPTPAPMLAPAAMSRPANLPIQASHHSHPFENLSRNHAPLMQREIPQAPASFIFHNPASLPPESYINLGVKQNPFMIPVGVSGNAPVPFTHPHAQLLPGPFDSQLLPGPFAPQPTQFLVPYDALKMSNFGEGPLPGEPAPGVLHLTRATNVPSGYNIRNEQRVGNIDYLGPSPVSSRYAFAGPTISYKRGWP